MKIENDYPTIKTKINKLLLARKVILLIGNHFEISNLLYL